MDTRTPESPPAEPSGGMGPSEPTASSQPSEQPFEPAAPSEHDDPAFVDLVQRILAKAESPEAAAHHLARLVSATQAVTHDLELPTALRNIVEVACELVSARYGALGVISADGSLEEFVHDGMSEQEVAELGDLPHGHGLLGAVISEAKAVRLDDLGEDPRAIGFPPGHPPMKRFLGVPVHVGDTIYGNLYLADSERGAFDETDEHIITALAGVAGAAIANARLYDQARLGQRWLAASAEINQRLLSGELDGADLSGVAELVLELSDAQFVGVTLADAERDWFSLLLGPLSAAAESEDGGLLAALPRLIREAGRSGADTEGALRALEDRVTEESVVLGATAILPLTDSSTGTEGALLIARAPGRHPFTTGERTMAERFVRSVAIARELSISRTDRERIALAEERDRIARDLHDHVIQSLFAVGLSLQSVLTEASGGVAARIGAQVDAIDVTIRQIRQTIFQLSAAPNAAVYSQKARLNTLVRQILEGEGIDSSLDFSGPVDTLIDSELGEEVSAVIREGLSNVVRHAQASRVDVSVVVTATEVRVVVTDNGRGLGELAKRSGLENLAKRAEMRGGRFATAGRAPSGTTIDWTVPVAS